jgi:adenylylsulfate kinase
MGQAQGWAIWLTGLPASGKTALAQALRSRLADRGVAATVLDSDELRRVMTPDASYAPAERDWFYDRLVELAGERARAGENVIIAATGNRRSYRAAARARLAPRFAEVWLRCPVDICRSRDWKGLYQRADAGLLSNLPGVDAPYEPPEAPEAVVDTGQQTPEQAADRLLAALPFLQIIKAAANTREAF